MVRGERDAVSVFAVVYPKMVLRLFGAKIGESLIYRTATIYDPANLRIGDMSCIGPRVNLYCKDRIEIGDNTVMSQDSYLCTASHDVSSPIMALTTKPIRIGNGCWVAAYAKILPGVTIGDGGVVGCASVVTKDVSPWIVVGGNPARKLKDRKIVE